MNMDPSQQGAPPAAGSPLAPPPAGPPAGQAAYGAPASATGPSGPRASFGQRLGAYLLDGVIVAIPYAILAAALKGVGIALGVLLIVGYFIYFEGGPSGQTLGKKALNLRVIDYATGGPIGYGRAFLRYISRILSSFFLLGYLWMLWDREKQTWHDKLATTVVVPVSAYPVPTSGASAGTGGAPLGG